MTKAGKYAAAGTATLAAVAAIAVGTTALVSDSSTTSTVSVAAPQNLRAYEVGPDYAKVSFGPSQIGEMSIAPFSNGRGAKISWNPAFDTLYPTSVTYQYIKNGKIIWTGRTQTYANVGFTLKVRKFTTCVIPHSTSGFGPKRCTTWTAPQ